MPQRTKGLARTSLKRNRNSLAQLRNTAASRGGTAAEHPRAAATRPADTGFSPAVKLSVRKRAGHGDVDDASCEACGVWLGTDRGQVHHRMDRQMGGSKLRNGIQNAALLCGNPVDFTTCHGKATRGDKDLGPDATGWWLEHGQNPALIPVIVHGIGMPVYLTRAGTYSAEPDLGGAS
jgi:hypothetical protein